MAICTCFPHLSPLGTYELYTCHQLVFHSGCLGPYEFTLVSHTCLAYLFPTLVCHSGCLGPHEFTLVSDLSPTLGFLGCMRHLPPTLVSRTCFPHLSFHTCLLGPYEFAFFPCTCLHAECFGPYEFTLVFHLSPTLGAFGRMSFTLILSHFSPACLPHLSPTLGALGGMSLHLSPTLVFHSACSLSCGPHGFTLVFQTCLPLWVLRSINAGKDAEMILVAAK